MPDAVYIVMEHAFGEEIFMTPYVSEASAREHYEKTLKLYCDLRKPFYPIQEDEARDYFLYGNREQPRFECGIYKEELYA